MKRTIITVAAAVFLFLALCIGRAIYMTLPFVSGDLSKAYARMVKEQVLTQWECTPVSDREELMLSLIGRFSPEDAALIKQGRIWKDELKAKEEAGTLTVAERERLYSGYYYETPLIGRSLGWKAEFSAPICDQKLSGMWKEIYDGDKMCDRPYMSVSDGRLIYEDDYSRWTMEELAWTKVIEQEFEQVSKRKAAIVVSGYQKVQAARLKRAKDYVLNLPASQVPEGSVEQMIEAESLKLSCLEQ